MTAHQGSIDAYRVRGRSGVRTERGTGGRLWRAAVATAAGVLTVALLVPALPRLAATATWEAFDGKNILLIGIDAPKPKSEGTYTDVLAVLHFGAPSTPLTLLSLTRDTRALLPQGPIGLQKINVAYMAGGVDLVREMVTDYTGLPIHAHALVDFDGFVRIIDLLGGVEVSVPAPMSYRDRAGGLDIELRAGQQRLSGRQALAFVRWRQSDQDRIQRQQAFARALAHALLRPVNVKNAARVADAIATSAQTDLSAVQVAGLINLAAQLGAGDLDCKLLTGRYDVTTDWLHVVPLADRQAALAAMGSQLAVDHEVDAVRTPAKLLADATLARHDGETLIAFKYLRALMERYPRSEEAASAAPILCSLGVANDDIPTAIGCLAAWLLEQDDPGRIASGCELLGHLNVAVYDMEAAYAAWRRALEASSDEASKSALIDRVLYSFGCIRKPALAALNLSAWKADKIPPDIRLYLTGWRAQVAGDKAAALAAFEELTQSQPDSLFAPEARVAAGDLLRDMGQVDRAMREYGTVIERHAIFRQAAARAHLHRAYVLSLQGNLRKALETDEYVLANYPDQRDIWGAAAQHVGVLETKLGITRDAAVLLKYGELDVAERDELLAPIQERCARYEELSRSEAISTQARLWALRRLVSMYLSLGARDEALTAMRRLMMEAPDADGTVEAAIELARWLGRRHNEYTEGHHLLEEVAGVVTDRKTRARVELQMAYLLQGSERESTGRDDAIRKQAREALLVYCREYADLPTYLASAYLELAKMAGHERDWVDMAGYARAALHTGTDDGMQQVLAYIMLGYVAVVRNDYSGALESYRSAQAVLDRWQPRDSFFYQMEGQVLNAMGDAHVHLGEKAEAIRCFETVLAEERMPNYHGFAAHGLEKLKGGSDG